MTGEHDLGIAGWTYTATRQGRFVIAAGYCAHEPAALPIITTYARTEPEAVGRLFRQVVRWETRRGTTLPRDIMEQEGD